MSIPTYPTLGTSVFGDYPLGVFPEPIGWAETTTTPITDGVLYVHIETKAEAFQRRSNTYADHAMTAGLQGDDFAAELMAEVADLFALLASLATVILSES